MGRYFDDFKLGDVYRHWPGRTLRAADNTWFTLLTMNTHPVHFDDAYSAETQHGRCLVNGTLVFSVVVGMSVYEVSDRCIANLDYEAIKHHGPVFAGDTLYAESEVLAIRPSRSKPDRGVVHVETRAWNQDGAPVMSYRRHLLVPRQPDILPEDRIRPRKGAFAAPGE